MFKAILFDLDGTLLNIDMNYFLRQYFKKMVTMAKKYGYENVDKLPEQVYKSTEVMINDRNPETTNEEVFMRDFYANWIYSKEEFNPFFEEFYNKGFPQLKEYCSSFDGIPEMMEKVSKKADKIVIATNAVFPLSALKDRLEWAGIGDFDFDLVTSYEIMHFCKPHINYYQEIAEKIEVKPGECLMIGNDIGEDLIAGRLGMKTFLVEDCLIDKGINLTPDWRGNLTDLFDFIDRL